MLRLDSIALLESAIKTLPGLSTNLAPGAPHTYVLAIQTNKLLQLHSVGLEQIYSRVAIRSTDTLDGEVFMWPLAELKITLEQLDNNYALQISNQQSATELRTYVEIIEDKIQSLDVCFLQAFGGSFDEFSLIEPQVALGDFVTSGAATLETLSRAVTYGDYKSRAGGDRAVLLDIRPQQITIYAIPQAAPNFYLAQQIKPIKSTLTELCPVIILACHLAEIVSFFAEKDLETLSWTIYSDLVEITANDNKRQLRIPRQNLDKFSYLKPITASFEGDLGQSMATYSLPLSRMVAATKAQQATRSNNRFIKVSASQTQIHLGKVSDILNREESLVEVYKAVEQIPLPKIIVNGPALLKSLQVLDNFLKKTEMDSNLQLQFWQKAIGNNTRWVLQIQLEHNSLDCTMPNILAGINVQM